MWCLRPLLKGKKWYCEEALVRVRLARCLLATIWQLVEEVEMVGRAGVVSVDLAVPSTRCLSLSGLREYHAVRLVSTRDIADVN